MIRTLCAKSQGMVSDSLEISTHYSLNLAKYWSREHHNSITKRGHELCMRYVANIPRVELSVTGPVSWAVYGPCVPGRCGVLRRKTTPGTFILPGVRQVFKKTNTQMHFYVIVQMN